MKASIHPTAVVGPDVRLGGGVFIGPYAILEGEVHVGDGTHIAPHAYLQGPLHIGGGCRVGFSVALGLEPQIKAANVDEPLEGESPEGETIECELRGATRIGARCVFREHAQVHRATDAGAETVVGDGAYVMAGAHIAHDCTVGRNVVLCNQALLAGHVSVGDNAFISGHCVVQQFSRIGEVAMIGGLTSVHRDAPPFSMVVGNRPARLEGLNTVGLRRLGIEGANRQELRRAFQILFRSDAPLEERFEVLRAEDLRSSEVRRLRRFLEESERGVIGFGGGPGSARLTSGRVR